MTATSPVHAALVAARAAIEGVRAEALAQFGWTHVELEAVAQGDTVGVRGSIVARSVLNRILARCEGMGVEGVTMLSSGRFVAAPPDGAAVFRRPDRSAPGDLATELDGDEVVEWLAEHAGATLVRACDGTVGWTAAPLVHGVMRPPLLATAAIDVDAIAAAWPAWIGAPYRLGGRRAGGIDCSALVQRLLDVAALRVPRHSSDQLAIGAEPGPCGEPGTIVAIVSADEAPCHVGIAVGQGLVVHASRSRSAAVAEPLATFVARASRVAHVPADAIVALQRRAAGDPDLLAALQPGPAAAGFGGR